MTLKDNISNSVMALGLAGAISCFSSGVYYETQRESASSIVKRMYDVEHRLVRMNGKEIADAIVESSRFVMQYNALVEEYKSLKSDPSLMQERGRFEQDDQNIRCNTGWSLGLMCGFFALVASAIGYKYRKD